MLCCKLCVPLHIGTSGNRSIADEGSMGGLESGSGATGKILQRTKLPTRTSNIFVHVTICLCAHVTVPRSKQTLVRHGKNWVNRE